MREIIAHGIAQYLEEQGFSILYSPGIPPVCTAEFGAGHIPPCIKVLHWHTTSVQLIIYFLPDNVLTSELYYHASYDYASSEPTEERRCDYADPELLEHIIKAIRDIQKVIKTRNQYHAK